MENEPSETPVKRAGAPLVSPSGRKAHRPHSVELSRARELARRVHTPQAQRAASQAHIPSNSAVDTYTTPTSPEVTVYEDVSLSEQNTPAAPGLMDTQLADESNQAAIPTDAADNDAAAQRTDPPACATDDDFIDSNRGSVRFSMPGARASDSYFFTGNHDQPSNATNTPSMYGGATATNVFGNANDNPIPSSDPAEHVCTSSHNADESMGNADENVDCNARKGTKKADQMPEYKRENRVTSQSIDDLRKHARFLREEADKAAAELASLTHSWTEDANFNLVHAAKQIDACILVTSRLASAHAYAYKTEHPDAEYPQGCPIPSPGKKSDPQRIRSIGVSAVPEMKEACCQATESAVNGSSSEQDNCNTVKELQLVMRGPIDDSSSPRPSSNDDVNAFGVDPEGAAFQICDGSHLNDRTSETQHGGALGKVQKCQPVGRLRGRGSVNACGFIGAASTLQQSTVCSLDGYPCARVWNVNAQGNLLHSISAMSEKLATPTTACVSKSNLYVATRDGELLRLSMQDHSISVDARAKLPNNTTNKAMSVAEQSKNAQVALGDIAGNVYVYLSDETGLYRLCTFSVPDASDVRDVKLLTRNDEAEHSSPLLATASDAGVHTFQLGPLKRPKHYTCEASSSVDGHIESSQYVPIASWIGELYAHTPLT